MHNLATSNNPKCFRQDILRYLDGEMSLEQECIFEEHLSRCKDCHSELNEQKTMLAALDFAFEDDSVIEPPRDFAKIVAAKAESGVSGLRHPKERPLALLLCLFMALVALVGLGVGSNSFLSVVYNVGEQIYSVAVLAGHLIHDVSLGMAIILRSLSHQAVLYPYSLGLISLFILFLITLAGYAFRLTVVRK